MPGVHHVAPSAIDLVAVVAVGVAAEVAIAAEAAGEVLAKAEDADADGGVHLLTLQTSPTCLTDTTLSPSQHMLLPTATTSMWMPCSASTFSTPM